MPICPSCGHEYVAGAGQIYCGHCAGRLTETATVVERGRYDSPGCPEQQDQRASQRPIVGISVATIIGGFNLVWSGAVLFKSLFGEANSTQSTLYQAFPGVQLLTLFGGSIAETGNAALLIGALLAFLSHPAGSKTVRVTCCGMLLATFTIGMIRYFVITKADAWLTLDLTTEGAIIGGLVGSWLGAVFQWGLILFLFRKRQKVTTTEAQPQPKTPVTGALGG